MKKPTLFVAALALTLSATGPKAHAFDNSDRAWEARERHEEAMEKAEAAKRRAHRQMLIDHAWDKIEDAKDGIRDGIEEAFLTVKKHVEALAFDAKMVTMEATRGVRNEARTIHNERPFLFGDYVEVLKKGNQVSLLYCDSRIAKLANGQRCEKLHAGSFNVAELKGCLKNAGDNKQPGMVLNRQLSSDMAQDKEFKVDRFKMFDTKDDYKAYLNSCHARIAARHRSAAPAIAKAPRPTPRVIASPAPAAPVDQPKLEFHPVQAPDEVPPPAAAEGTL
ncbi:MAG: hypothetical protein ACXVB9_05535 [Bdellovibrionota bacterium]